MKSLVILYNGQECSEYVQSKIVETLVVSGVAQNGDVQVFSLSDEDVATAMVTVVKPTRKKPNIEPQKNALTYIGEKYSSFLIGPNKNRTNFLIAVSKDINDDSKLFKAAEIINANHTFPEETMVKYGFNSDTIDIIRKIYISRV